MTCHLQENRGGVVAQTDCTEEELSLVEVQLDNGLFAQVVPVENAAQQQTVNHQPNDVAQTPNLMVLAQLPLDNMVALKNLLDGYTTYAAAYVTIKNADIQLQHARTAAEVEGHKARAAAEVDIHRARAAAETAIIDRRIAEHVEINRGQRPKRSPGTPLSSSDLPVVKRPRTQRSIGTGAWCTR